MATCAQVIFGMAVSFVSRRACVQPYRGEAQPQSKVDIWCSDGGMLGTKRETLEGGSHAAVPLPDRV